MTRYLSLFLAGALCALSVPALAGPIMVFVSGRGADGAGCGTVTSPCRTMQVAHDRVDAGGYIVALDPADFGKVAIMKSVNISNESVGAALLRAPGPGTCGVGVFGQETVVRLRGLTIEGNGLSTSGICFNAGKRIEIADSVVRNATNQGVTMAAFATPSFAIFNTTFTDNGSTGVLFSVLSGYAKGLRFINNSRGGMTFQEPGRPFPSPIVIEDSLIANDPGKSAPAAIGIRADNIPLVLRNTTVRGFPIGVDSGWALIRLSRSILTGNAVAARGAIFESSGDNVIRGNVDDTLGVIGPGALR